jgi:hypothetical protein
MSKSFIYSNIYTYRFLMNILYPLKYKKRFLEISREISEKDSNILELCFGDIYIANECRKNGINWTGIDINENFVDFAAKRGYNAIKKDISKIDSFPLSDICIISGSLYHFHGEIESLIQKMLDSTQKIIISEPINNLSSKKGFIGKISGILTNAGKGAENFRYNRQSITDMLNKLKDKLNFEYRIISANHDIVIEIKKNERN